MSLLRHQRQKAVALQRQRQRQRQQRAHIRFPVGKTAKPLTQLMLLSPSVNGAIIESSEGFSCRSRIIGVSTGRPSAGWPSKPARPPFGPPLSRTPARAPRKGSIMCRNCHSPSRRTLLIVKAHSKRDGLHFRLFSRLE
jgi:hypothetical protein